MTPPRITLPIHEVLDGIVEALAAPGSSCVVVAPPGSGKTTVVPLAIDDAPWCDGRVLLVEPRRLAARAAAQRMAAARGEAVGRRVGWRMRGDTKVSSSTRIEVVTEGVLTRMVHADPSLEGVAVVVLDEFHERSLDLDLALALLLDARAHLRPDLRIAVMSATLDGAAVASLLDDAPVVTGGASPHPVHVEWCGPSSMRLDPDAVAAAVRSALDLQPDGDVLVFLPGAAEIRRVASAIGDAGRHVDVLPLHGRLDVASQDRALTRVDGRRRVVLATSIAETSLTIDGVRSVVDAGWSREPRYDAARAMGGLVTVRVSRAGAAQRAGRAGRTAPGVCLRLWAAHEHDRLAPRAEPEIRHADLVPLALDLVRWGDPDGVTLRWLDPPDPGVLGAARDVLRALGLVQAGPSGRVQLTIDGDRCADLPTHPRLARAIVRADVLGHGATACTVVAALGEREVADAGPDARHAIERTLRRRDAIADRVRREARRLASTAGIGDGAVDLDATGLVLALAHPDRVARRRGDGGRFLLTSGAGAALDAPDAMADAPWLAVAELDRAPGRADARIRLAAPLDEHDVEVALGHLEEVVDVVRWDDRSGDVIARQEARIGAVVRASRPLDPASVRDLVVAALLEGVRRIGLESLPRLPEADALRARVALCRRVLGDDWPSLDDDALLDSLETWLEPWLGDVRRRRDLGRVDVHAALRGRLGWPAAARLDHLAPTHLVTPAGASRPVDYSGETPALAVRMQEMFGAPTSPTVLDGRVRVVLHLLSPAGRPLQVTSDLAGFWAGAYAQVRGEMRGRYPKHHWPDDPASASPSTRSTKPR